jgi:hypothetical protein
MDIAALVISLLSATVASSTLIYTRTWRREAHRAAIIAYYMTVRKRQVFEDPNVALWNASGVHDSVYRIRDDLMSALPTLPAPALAIGERMIDACLRYLIELRPLWGKDGSDKMTEEAVHLHRAWVEALNGEIRALRELSTGGRG